MAEFKLSDVELRQAVSEWVERRLRPGHEITGVVLHERSATASIREPERETIGDVIDELAENAMREDES